MIVSLFIRIIREEQCKEVLGEFLVVIIIHKRMSGLVDIKLKNWLLPDFSSWDVSDLHLEDHNVCNCTL